MTYLLLAIVPVSLLAHYLVGVPPLVDFILGAVAIAILADWTRRGFCDGVGVRLPTVCIRPGAPNQAASGFFSAGRCVS